MNIALEQTEEHVNGTVTNRYGDAFIRGNNGTFRWHLLAVLPPD
jgi:U6 snRNA-associated Sm-like protein LSm6